jgi:hypothetical protein
VTLPTHGSRGDVGQIGKSVFTTYLFAFEATAGLLVIAVVGAVSLARRPSDIEDLDRPEPSDEWLAPTSGPDGAAETEPPAASIGEAEAEAPAPKADGAAEVGVGSGPVGRIEGGEVSG